MIYCYLDITKKYTRRENMQLAEVLEKTPWDQPEPLRTYLTKNPSHGRRPEVKILATWRHMSI